MMNDTPNTEGIERDLLLIESLMAVVPNPQLMTPTADILAKNGAEPAVIDMLRGYGTLINILQAATEQDDLFDHELSLYDRLSTAYYELTNNDDGGDIQFRLRHD